MTWNLPTKYDFVEWQKFVEGQPITQW
jgi:hypothetical protein